ncbi:MAG: tRNA 2-thiocytidine(32) synthetase TtcA [Proteobacteria bacterium]|nr:tRNA 2-thiocytidine(32) synthetase TtcA [Pseudomonadota bacterium]
MSDLVIPPPMSRSRAAKAPIRDTSGRRGSKLERLIVKKAGQAIADFNMIVEGDRIMVCISGGKDSYAMLEVLQLLQRRSPVRFEIIAVNIDQGWAGYDTATIAAYLERSGVIYYMIDKDIASVVEANLEPGDTPCSLCARLRRGILYNLAVELECTKIALGHHADDIIETLLLNLFYSGRLAAMPAKLYSDDGRNMVIRPLAYVLESLIVEFLDERKFPVVSCGCASCGLPDQKRQVVKRLLTSLEERDPSIKHQMLAAVQNVKPSQLLDSALLAQLNLPH